MPHPTITQKVDKNQNRKVRICSLVFVNLQTRYFDGKLTWGHCGDRQSCCFDVSIGCHPERTNPLRNERNRVILQTRVDEFVILVRDVDLVS